MDTNRLLITFAVIAYNAEKYIREAVEGAFAQTYTPLQIVLSDDASSDATFQIMEEMASAYQGPHTVLLNHNDHNLGIGAHVNRIMELAKGEYVVIAAGDDISLPERTQRIYETFQDSNRHAMAVFSDHEEIDENGVNQGIASNIPPEGFCSPLEMCRHLFRGITGASNAWHRKVFDVFGPMAEDVTFEDRVIAFRAALLGDIVHIPEPLVRYRRHDANTVMMFHSHDIEQRVHLMRCYLHVYQNNKQDLMNFKSKFEVQNKMVSRCRMIMDCRIRKFRSYLRIFSGRPLGMIMGMLVLTINGGSPLHGVRHFVDVIHQRYFTPARSQQH